MHCNSQIEIPSTFATARLATEFWPAGVSQTGQREQMSLYQHLRVHQVFGGGTGIGKTIITTALCLASDRLGERSSYLKPIGTGTSSDDGHVHRFLGRDSRTKCLYTFDEPVSPHLAAQRMTNNHSDPESPSRDDAATIPTDEQFIRSVYDHIRLTAEHTAPGSSGSLFIESAGGVHSPTLSGRSQLVAYRPLRLPTILIGSPLLGGISSTVSAYESLKLHGYDVDAMLVLKEDYYQNHSYFQDWCKEHGILYGVVEHPPDQLESDLELDHCQMRDYYRRVTTPGSAAASIVLSLQELHLRRLAELDSMPRRAMDQVWWPFVQHDSISDPRQVTVIDSAHKDFMLNYQQNLPDLASDRSAAEGKTQQCTDSLLTARFDGSGSWWTQSLGHSHPSLSLSAAYAAGRYGHVLFPRCIHQPALDLTETLLRTVGQKWARRVFFSDNGSTGIEVGLKMGLGSYSRRFRLEKGSHPELGVIGLRGSYHGDTIGAMDASEGSIFNQQVDWYRGKGFWLEAPQVMMISNDEATIRAEGTQWDQNSWRKSYKNLHEIYDLDKRLAEDELSNYYEKHIFNMLLEARRSCRFLLGSLILEPIVMGAGGMIFVDPLFQNVLIKVVRNNPCLFDPQLEAVTNRSNSAGSDCSTSTDWSGLPVIFDEVFSGLYRLGTSTAANILKLSPDVAIYSKTLSAGTVPLSVTLTTEAIFDSFRGRDSMSALLHGHSYTAHPIGCSVANAGLKTYKNMESMGYWNHAKADWRVSQTNEDNDQPHLVWSLWSREFLERVCLFESVEGVMSLGTVLAIYLKDDGKSKGYSSEVASRFLDRFNDTRNNLNFGMNPEREQKEEDDNMMAIPFGIHSRPLGNVVYFITSLNTPKEMIKVIESRIIKVFD